MIRHGHLHALNSRGGPPSQARCCFLRQQRVSHVRAFLRHSPLDSRVMTLALAVFLDLTLLEDAPELHERLLIFRCETAQPRAKFVVIQLGRCGFEVRLCIAPEQYTERRHPRRKVRIRWSPSDPARRRRTFISSPRPRFAYYQCLVGPSAHLFVGILTTGGVDWPLVEWYTQPPAQVWDDLGC